MNMGDVAVPVMIGVLKLRKRVIVRWALHSNIIDFDFLVCLQIVIHDHSARSDNGHLTDFSRLEPTALDGGETLATKIQRHVSYVLDMRGHVRVSLTINSQRELSENMENDRDIVRREIPSDVYIFLKQTQVKAARIDVTDVANVSRLHDLDNFTHWRRVEEGMVDHQDQVLGPGNLN